MKGDRVSVVIPCRNRSGFLAQTLKNLYGQLEVGDEVVIADNGSTDSLPQVLEPYGGEVTVVPVSYEGHWMRNRVLNRGIEAAVNDLIIVLDADTVPQPTCIQRLRDAGGEGTYVSGLVLFRVLYEETGKQGNRAQRRKAKPELMPRTQLMGTAPPDQVVANVLAGAVQGVTGGCICFHRGDWRRVGGYSEEFDGRWGLGETAFYLKMHYAGVRMVSLDRWNPVTLEGCVAVHIDDETPRRKAVAKRRLAEKEENRQLLLRLLPDYERGIFKEEK